MITAADAIDEAYNIALPLESMVTGGVYKYARPSNSSLEDIVINILGTDFEQFQEGTLNVNVFVPYPVYTAVIDGKRQEMQDLPNASRIRVLCDEIHDIYKFYYNKEKGILMELIQQLPLQDLQQKATLINNRITIRAKNL